MRTNSKTSHVRSIEPHVTKNQTTTEMTEILAAYCPPLLPGKVTGSGDASLPRLCIKIEVSSHTKYLF